MAAKPTWDWKMSGFLAAGAPMSKTIDTFCDTVYTATGGRLKITPYHASVLSPMPDVTKLLGTGSFELGMYGYNYTSGVTSAGVVTLLPGLMPQNNMKENAALMQFVAFHPWAEAQAKKLNIINVYEHANGNGWFVLRNKQVNALGDLKGLNVRASGITNEIAKAWSANPVNVPSGETVEAFQKGILDLQLVEIAEGWKSGQYQYTKYYGNSKIYGGSYAGGANIDAWNKLPKDVQDIFTKVVKEQLPQWNSDYYDTDTAVAIAGITKFGGVIYDFDPAKLQQIYEAAYPVYDIWYNDQVKNGMGADAKAFWTDLINFRNQLTKTTWTGWMPK
jgi:TRAP-type transport system periplasmic protein